MSYASGAFPATKPALRPTPKMMSASPRAVSVSGALDVIFSMHPNTSVPPRETPPTPMTAPAMVAAPLPSLPRTCRMPRMVFFLQVVDPLRQRGQQVRVCVPHFTERGDFPVVDGHPLVDRPGPPGKRERLHDEGRHHPDRAHDYRQDAHPHIHPAELLLLHQVYNSPARTPARVTASQFMPPLPVVSPGRSMGAASWRKNSRGSGAPGLH